MVPWQRKPLVRSWGTWARTVLFQAMLPTVEPKQKLGVAKKAFAVSAGVEQTTWHRVVRVSAWTLGALPQQKPLLEELRRKSRKVLN